MHFINNGYQSSACHCQCLFHSRCIICKPRFYRCELQLLFYFRKCLVRSFKCIIDGTFATVRNLMMILQWTICCLYRSFPHLILCPIVLIKRIHRILANVFTSFLFTFVVVTIIIRKIFLLVLSYNCINNCYYNC